MKFFIAVAAALATIAVAAPADNTKASVSNENAVLNALLTTRSANHQYGEDGPAPNGCFWSGTAHYCLGSCSEGYEETKQGVCGDGECCLTGVKVLCCKRK